MSLLMLRGPVLAQGGAVAPPIDIGTAWELDTTRTPAGYTLSEGNRTAVNTAGGSDYRRWVPSAKAILLWDARCYWEVLCADTGAAAFDGYLGVISEAMREEFDSGNNPITLGSIGWRGNGRLWSSDTASATQRRTGLPGFGAGDVAMFVFDPASASLWIGKNGLWHDDPAIGAATWTAAPSPAFYPFVQGRDPGDGGTLRSLPSAFSYPVPPGTRPLGREDPDLRIFAAEAWIDLGGSAPLTAAGAELFLDLGGSGAFTAAQATLYIELETP